MPECRQRYLARRQTVAACIEAGTIKGKVIVNVLTRAKQNLRQAWSKKHRRGFPHGWRDNPAFTRRKGIEDSIDATPSILVRRPTRKRSKPDRPDVTIFSK